MTDRADSGASSAIALPLSEHARVRTHDVDEIREVVAQAFCGHQLLPLDGRGAVDARFHAVQLDRVGLHYLEYGAEVRIAPGELRDFFLVPIPLAGRAEVVCGGESVLSDSLMASVPAPDRDLIMRWGAGTRQLIVWIDRAGLEWHLSRMLGKPVAKPLRFDLGMDMTRQAVRSWRNVVELLTREIDTDGGIPAEPLAMTELQRLLFSQLLLAQPNNYSADLHREPMGSAPKVIKRAVELIEAHAAEPLTVEDVAEAVGISVRALQEGFRRFLDTTPMNQLRDVRLGHIRAELAVADPTRTTVSEVATRWGFLHPGRFAALYRRRFGESPSATLRGWSLGG